MLLQNNSESITIQLFISTDTVCATRKSLRSEIWNKVLVRKNKHIPKIVLSFKHISDIILLVKN